MVISSRGLELVATRDKLSTEGPGVSNDLLGIGLPCWLASLEESGSDTSNGLRR